MASEAMKRVSVEEGVASKMEAHHRARAGAREEARRDLQHKANEQVRFAASSALPTSHTVCTSMSAALTLVCHDCFGQGLEFRRCSKYPMIVPPVVDLA